MTFEYGGQILASWVLEAISIESGKLTYKQNQCKYPFTSYSAYSTAQPPFVSVLPLVIMMPVTELNLPFWVSDILHCARHVRDILLSLSFSATQAQGPKARAKDER